MQMLDFIYDSLDTVKKLKFPTVKQITRLTLAIFALVIVAGTYFILADTIFSGGYKAFYSIMTEGQLPSSWTNTTGVIDASVLPANNQLSGTEDSGLDLAVLTGTEETEN